MCTVCPNSWVDWRISTVHSCTFRCLPGKASLKWSGRLNSQQADYNLDFQREQMVLHLHCLLRCIVCPCTCCVMTNFVSLAVQLFSTFNRLFYNLLLGLIIVFGFSFLLCIFWQVNIEWNTVFSKIFCSNLWWWGTITNILILLDLTWFSTYLCRLSSKIDLIHLLGRWLYHQWKLLKWG